MAVVTGQFARVATLIKDGRTDGLWTDRLGTDITDGRHYVLESKWGFAFSAENTNV
jgi:hypothetical protein